jgi:hypothetical protein
METDEQDMTLHSKEFLQVSNKLAVTLKESNNCLVKVKGRKCHAEKAIKNEEKQVQHLLDLTDLHLADLRLNRPNFGIRLFHRYRTSIVETREVW